MKSVYLYSIYEQNRLKLFSFRTKVVERSYSDSIETFEELKVVRITSGEGIWTINQYDYEISEGDIFLLAPTDLRKIKEVHSDQGIKMEQISFLPVVFYPRMRVTEVFFDSSRRSPFVPHDDNLFPKISKCFDNIRDEVTSDVRLKDEFIIAKLSELLVYITRAVSLDEDNSVRTQSSANYKIICEAVAYINKHYSEELTLPMLAEKYHLSPAYFSRLFFEFNGINLQRYISRCRIAHTVELIEKEGMNVLDAAFECGFTSSSGFYKAFREHTGTTPREYSANNK